MGLFGKKEKITVCDMCGKADIEGCGSVFEHIEQITSDGPAWLPERFREQVPGEYTWLCVRCGSYPEMVWPSDVGAYAGIVLHLGSAHYVGMMKGAPRPNVMMTQAR